MLANYFIVVEGKLANVVVAVTRNERRDAVVLLAFQGDRVDPDVALAGVDVAANLDFGRERRQQKILAGHGTESAVRVAVGGLPVDLRHRVIRGQVNRAVVVAIFFVGQDRGVIVQRAVNRTGVFVHADSRRVVAVFDVRRTQIQPDGKFFVHPVLDIQTGRVAIHARVQQHAFLVEIPQQNIILRGLISPLNDKS